MKTRGRRVNEDQLALVFGHDHHSLESLLSERTRGAVRLTITDNSASMLSVREKGGSLSVRLHRIFLDAGPEVLEEVAGFIGGGIRRTPRIREYIRVRVQALRPPRSRPQRLRTDGKCHDLGEVFDRLNREYFGGRLKTPIGWGVSTRKRAVRRRTLGSYNGRTDTIRINPALDSLKVPAYFVEFVVYHEMLHADMGSVKSGSRNLVHTMEFRERERLFGDYEKAIRWERSGQRVR